MTAPTPLPTPATTPRTAALPGDVWVPITLRWRYVMPGQTFVSPSSGHLWCVVSVEWGHDGIRATCTRAADSRTHLVDPDDVVDVLLPMHEKEAITAIRDQFGAQFVESREIRGVSA